MAEHDAFGRKEDDDPLEAMGWADQPAPAAETVELESPAPLQPEPPVAPPAEPETAAAAPRALSGDERKLAERRAALAALKASRAQRPRSPLRWVARAFFVIVVLIIAGSVFAIGAIDGEVEEGRVVEATPVEEDSGRGAPAGPPGALDRRSMILRGNLAPALRGLQREMGGRPRVVRVEAERVDVVAQRGGDVVVGQARWDGRPRVLSRSPGGTTVGTYAWGDVDLSAPRRAVRGALRRAGRPSSALQYLVLMDAAGLRWTVVVTGAPGGFVSADPSGRVG